MQVLEVRTKPISPDQLLKQLPVISGLLQDWGHTLVLVTYGFGSNLPMDQLWHPVEVAALESHVLSSVQRDIFRPGQSDLHIEDQTKSLEFLLCHESDIHFASTDQELVEQVIALWRGQGVAVYVSPGPKGSAFQKEWKLIDGASHAR